MLLPALPGYVKMFTDLVVDPTWTKYSPLNTEIKLQGSGFAKETSCSKSKSNVYTLSFYPRATYVFWSC